jgi:predicted RNA-binding protein with PIN domain
VIKQEVESGKPSPDFSFQLSAFRFPFFSYLRRMALVRILVDGYSLLHNWPELAAGKPRHSAAARDELIAQLTRYQDASGTPVTVIFDGSGAVKKGSPDEFARRVEVLYSGGGQTADDLIERAAFRFKEYGEVLVVTDDFAERDTVITLGGTASSCDNFIRTMAAAFDQMNEDLTNHNRRERDRFKRFPI